MLNLSKSNPIDWILSLTLCFANSILCSFSSSDKDGLLLILAIISLKSLSTVDTETAFSPSIGLNLCLLILASYLTPI